MRKEVGSLRNLEYYKEKSPLLTMFLDKKMSRDRSFWLNALNNRIDEKHLLEFTERFGTDWGHTVNALILIAWNFGLQERNVDIEFTTDITRSILFIGYEMGDIGGVEVILPKVCDQLKSVNYIYPGWFKKRVPKLIASRFVGSMLNTGAAYKTTAYDKSDRLAPFSDLTTEGHIKGFGLEIPQNESKTVMVQVFTILLRGNEKELSIHDPIGISIDDLSRCIRLKGHDTVIIDTSVTPKKYSKIDQISLNELEQWEEVFNSFEKATLILNN